MLYASRLVLPRLGNHLRCHIYPDNFSCGPNSAEPNGDEPELEELMAAFRRMIYSLPEPYREALLLTEFDGLTQQQLAEHVGISLSGAKSRVQRGREQLKTMLEECCSFEFDRRGTVRV